VIIVRFKPSVDKDTACFIICVFCISYAMEFAIIVMNLAGDYVGAWTLMLLLMFVPALSVLIVAVIVRGEKLSKYSIGFGSLRLAPVAYMYPIALIFCAAALMHMLGFQIDWRLRYFERIIEEATEGSNANPEQIVRFLVLGSLAAPFVNMIFAAGEEVGWRGYLLDKLLERNSLGTSLVLTGIIWALWHAPLILFIGYNYPTLRGLGLLLYIPFCISHGTILAWLKFKSGGILIPALGHGAVNAFSWIGSYLYPHGDVFNLVVGMPGVLVSGVVAIVLYLDMRRDPRIVQRLAHSRHIFFLKVGELQ